VWAVVDAGWAVEVDRSGGGDAVRLDWTRGNVASASGFITRATTRRDMSDHPTGPVFADGALVDRLPEPLFLTPGHEFLRVERRQLHDAGRRLSGIDDEFEAALALDPDDPELPGRVRDLLDRGRELPVREDYAYDEPTDLAGIRERSPEGPRPVDEITALDRETAADAIHGGWLGACAGCLLGKPVQGWSRERILGFARDSGQYPIDGYLRSDVDPEVVERYDAHANLEPIDAFANEIAGMPIDDDIDYVVLGLQVLRAEGHDFESVDVATHWLESLPMFNTYTAERAAYRNLAELVMPPASATRRNPYREMIGATIRADPWGYAALGDPEYAAELAHRDARVSHVKNGVYGEMWAAATIAAAPFVDDPDDLLGVGLATVPANCRLAEVVDRVRQWHREGVPADAVADRIHERWDETSIYDWVHTLSNAMVIAFAVLYGDDFGHALRLAVETGFDTDSHAATVGSILGAAAGASALPDDWTDPLADTVETSLPGRGRESISELADETVAVWADSPRRV
jgi:ADP-ribosylglycohydrolase